MVKKSKVASHKAKNLGSISDTVVNGLNHLVPDPVVAVVKPNNEGIYVRRSRRRQSSQEQEIEYINPIDGEKGQDEACSGYNVGQRLLVSIQEKNDLGIDNSNNGDSSKQKSLDEKIDDLIKAIEGFKTNDFQKKVDFNYKSLYLDSQTKVEALTSENHKLARMLEIALGKFEVYDNFNKSNPTDMKIISKLDKVIEALASPMLHVGRFSPLSSDAETGGGVVAKETQPGLTRT